jgi:hybrid cluster-associated redox disulfide protein
MKITKDMTFNEIFNACPEKNMIIAEELKKIGLKCLGCHLSSSESIEEGMQNHGFSEEEIDRFIDKINTVLSNEK